MKKLIVLFSCFLIFFATTVNAEIKNPDTFVLAVSQNIRTLDPALAGDGSSSAKIKVIYQGLIAHDSPHVDRYVPVLATEVPTLENGGISKDGLTYTFTIRKGVKFHEGGELTAEDVEYSLKRNMIADPPAGPMWMLMSPLTGKARTRAKNEELVPGIFEAIDKSVERKGDKIIFHLSKAFPPFMGILCHNSALVIDKEWSIKQGAWDGNIANAQKYNHIPKNKLSLHQKTNGTGAYMLKSWVTSGEIVFERFDGYWGPQPKLKKAIVKYVPEWSTRKLMLQNGDADRVQVSPSFFEEVKAMPGVTVYTNPILRFSGIALVQKINAVGNPYVGSGKLDGKGIPADFFDDLDLRKAFCYAFDHDTYIEDVIYNLGTVPATMHIKGLPYYKEGTPRYTYDMEKAKAHMKKAWGGKVWEKGFEMTILCPAGRAEREAKMLMLKESIESLNPKFKIRLAHLPWKDYLAGHKLSKYPAYSTGWGADFPDPHDFLFPFFHSQGNNAKRRGYHNPEVDKLIDKAIGSIDPKVRGDAYEKLMYLWYQDAPLVVVSQNVELWAYRSWVKGFVPSPTFGQAFEDFRLMSKEE